MACDRNCKRVGGVAFGAGIPRAASQSGFVAGQEAATQEFRVIVSKTSPNTTRSMPFSNLPKTYLEPSRVKIVLDPPDVEKSIGVVLPSSYVVLSNGRETGLAVIPGLDRGQAGTQDIFREDNSQWWVLHIDSGKTLSTHSYKTPQEAQLLASALAKRRGWSIDEGDLTPEDTKRVQDIINLLDETLGYESG